MTAKQVAQDIFRAKPFDWPDPEPLPGGLPPVAQFNQIMLPELLRQWISDIAERMQCPPDYPAIAAMVALAAVVGRRVGIRPKRRDDWLVVPNLWGAVIGRPGVMKTPALQEPLRPLRGLEIEAARVHQDDMVVWEAREMVAKEAALVTRNQIRKAIKDGGDAQVIAKKFVEDDDDKPVRQRHLVNDTTVEKLGEILSDNPNGVLIFRDELVGFLWLMDRQGHEGSRAFYLEAWNGDGRFTYDRIGRGTIDIEAACVSILGGIQPGPLASYLSSMARGGAGDDGLVQRFQLMVWPDMPGKWLNVDRWPDTAARQQATKLFTRLNTLDSDTIGASRDEDDDDIPHLRFALDAQELFDEWRGELEGRLRSGELHPALEAHLAKYRSLVPALALLLHLADGGAGPVTTSAMVRAATWAEYLESHSRRVYATAISTDQTAARSLADRIVRGDVVSPFTLRDVYRPQWTGLATRELASAAVDVLVDLDWLRPEDVPTSGRSRRLFHVNPRIGRRGR